MVRVVVPFVKQVNRKIMIKKPNIIFVSLAPGLIMLRLSLEIRLVFERPWATKNMDAMRITDELVSPDQVSLNVRIPDASRMMAAIIATVAMRNFPLESRIITRKNVKNVKYICHAI